MATVKPPKPPRPYRDFLTPSLHRRFIKAAASTLLVCWVQAIWMGQWDRMLPLDETSSNDIYSHNLATAFWQWFPIGWAGFRTALIFISVFSIFILRVSQWHVGPSRTSAVVQTSFSWGMVRRFAQTLGTYTFSAWFYSEVYIWSCPVESNLAMVDPGKPYERERLNERPIYLRSMFVLLGVAQTLAHLWHDYDCVTFPVAKVTPEGLTRVTDPFSQIRSSWIRTANASVFRMTIMTFTGPFIYTLLIRQTAWHWTFAVARTMFTLPRSSKPAAYPPFVGDLVLRYFVNGALLIILWEFANTTFTAYLAQAPLKKASPLTNDAKDPNGSLIAGLKAKKEIPRNSAFWELALIAQEFPQRRETFFKELDRSGGTTWSQIVTVCLGELHAITKRIQDFQAGPPAATPSVYAQSQLQSLPKIAAAIPENDKIFTASPPAKGFRASVGRIARSADNPGQPLSLTAADKLQQETQSWVTSNYHELAVTLLRSPLGIPFRQTFARRARAVVLGQPPSGSSVSTIVDAATAMCKLAVHSQKEDKYGRASRDVANVIRTYTRTIVAIQAFVNDLKPHWTDVYYTDDPKKAEDIMTVLGALRQGLSDIIDDFGQYADDLGLTRVEMRQAKEAAASRDAWGLREANAKS